MLCAAWALTGLCVDVSRAQVRALLQVPAGLAGRVRGCTCLGPVRLKTHPVHCSLGAGQPRGYRQSPLIKKEQAAGGSTGREEAPSLRLGCVCEPASLGPGAGFCPVSLVSAFSSCRQGLGCSLFFFKSWLVVPAVPRRCGGQDS